MRRYAGLVDITRNVDGILRDMPLRETAGDWGIPSLALRLAAFDSGSAMATYPRIGAHQLAIGFAPGLRKRGRPDRRQADLPRRRTKPCRR